jgi:hypothetical protein
MSGNHVFLQYCIVVLPPSCHRITRTFSCLHSYIRLIREMKEKFSVDPNTLRNIPGSTAIVSSRPSTCGGEKNELPNTHIPKSRAHALWHRCRTSVKRMVINSGDSEFHQIVWDPRTGQPVRLPTSHKDNRNSGSSPEKTRETVKISYSKF